MKTRILSMLLLFVGFSFASLSGQEMTPRHEIKIGTSWINQTTGNVRAFSLQNQYVYRLTPRWGIAAGILSTQGSDKDLTDMIGAEGFDPALFVEAAYNVSDLETKLDLQSVMVVDLAGQLRLVNQERHGLSLSIGPSIGFFRYLQIANFEIGTFTNALGSRDIELVEYRHVRGIDIGGHGKLSYDYFINDHLSFGLQTSARFFANGDNQYEVGGNLGFRL